MIKDKLEKQLVGQSSTPYIACKIHPSEKCKSVKFDGYKLFDNQIHRFREVMDKMKSSS